MIQNIPSAFTIGQLIEPTLKRALARSGHQPGDPAALDGHMTIEALPTWYAGTTFRSALEADWAATLDTLGIAWEYEPEIIPLASGATYIPDFRLPAIGAWLEVKGTGVPRVEKAAELAEMLACRCTGPCGCEWPGGQLVLVGHPPAPAGGRRRRRHAGHPAWSNAAGPTTWLGRCPHCGTTGWSTLGGPDCRACQRRWTGAHAYRSGDEALLFIRSASLPAPGPDR